VQRHRRRIGSAYVVTAPHADGHLHDGAQAAVGL
jgi:hypothetical protein